MRSLDLLVSHYNKREFENKAKCLHTSSAKSAYKHFILQIVTLIIVFTGSSYCYYVPGPMRDIFHDVTSGFIGLLY